MGFNSVFKGIHVQEGALRPHPSYEHTRRPERDSDYLTTHSDDLEERVELHLYIPIRLHGRTGKL